MQGRSWSMEEDELLKKEYAEKKTLEEMAFNHMRTLGAIEARLNKLALEVVIYEEKVI